VLISTLSRRLLLPFFASIPIGTFLLLGFLTGPSSILLQPRHLLAMQEFKDAVVYRLQLQERELMVNNAIQEGRRDIVVPSSGHAVKTLNATNRSGRQIDGL
jgi:hypothetical protein